MSGMDGVDFQLARDTFGRLVLIRAGRSHAGVVPVRAFPLTAPDSGLAIVDALGHELAWLDTLDTLPAQSRQFVEDELSHREFMPEIVRLVGVSSFGTPSTWRVETDRGATSFVLKGEEDIRRLGDGLLIASSEGVAYRVRNLASLDRASRRLLERFL
ncbi:MAG: DUF1854 domain-containing protein [Burkholderiales bacterium]|nr:MAG: DUF1854 domain-containing protein [Burkholderiales bacterium]